MADSAVLDLPLPVFADPFHPDLFSDLSFDGDIAFSIDDLIDFPDDDPQDVVSSPDYAAPSPDSDNSATVAVTGEAQRKRKERGDADSSPDSSKLRRSDESDSSCMFHVGSEEEEKKKARLMRNRESAQLSRQRKKHYVEELEEKVRSMHSTISDLNGKIAFVMAENARLRQQLGSSGGKCSAPPLPPPGVYPMAPVPFPWIPCSGYAVRPPGAQVPVVPIPRLKTQQCVVSASAKPKRSEGKKVESRTKKVASVSFLGLLLIMLVVGGFDFGYKTMYSDRLTHGGGRVLTVAGDFMRLNETVKRELHAESGRCKKSVGDYCRSVRSKRESDVNGAKLKDGPSQASPGNASEPLLASLYIPRNDKLVKIDGNLIINSVLASERALSRSSQGHKETDLAVKDIVLEGVSSALAVGDSGRQGGRQGGKHGGAYLKHPRGQKALPSGSGDVYVDNLKSAPADRHLQDWFREGLEGPVFSSGMCTEIFQFDASQDSGNAGSIVPAASVVNASTNLTESAPYSARLKNRRIMHPEPTQLNISSLNQTKGGGFTRSQQGRSPRNTAAGKSMVVSVLVDPREVGDGSKIEGMVSPKTISRIFVVVLVDGVKYTTYSCTLPFKSSAQHLVTA